MASSRQGNLICVCKEKKFLTVGTVKPGCYALELNEKIGKAS